MNDNLGHQKGDALLKDVADVFNKYLRTTDLIYRYGGDEFVIALRNTSKAGAKLVAEKIRKKVAVDANKTLRKNIKISVSIGSTMVNEKDTMETIFNRADQAMYDAKCGGRNRVCIINS